MAILVTGDTDYIGSHTVLTLLERGDGVVAVDNLASTGKVSLDGIARLTGREPIVYIADVLDRQALRSIFAGHNITDIIHFAGLKSVSESIKEPPACYENNITGMLVLLDEVLAAGVNRFIFSSSAMVYDNPESVPLNEQSRTSGTTNPCGTSKLVVEQILADSSYAQPNFRITCPRYFNPVGAHPSGRAGEDPNGIPDNLAPYISQVAIDKLETVSVYGNGYPTPDGTNVRDCIYVMDLAAGRLAALDCQNKGTAYKVISLGTGVGYSVVNLIEAFEKAAQTKINYQSVARGPGDIAGCWSDPSLTYKELGWKAIYNLDEMMRDTWNWQKNSPSRYQI